MKLSRGIRNNNPANIRRGSSWLGLVSFLIDSSNNQRYYDKQFCQFQSMVYGVRALFVLLRTYYYKFKLNTISKVLYRFAPLSENNTYSYIANVTRFIDNSYRSESFDFFGQSYITENQPLCWFYNKRSPSFACKELAKAICKQESGFCLTDKLIDDAIALL